MTDQELIQELRDKAAVEGHGSIRRLLELAARRIEELTSRGEWVSVKDRLPDKTCYVIAYGRGKYYVCKFSSRYNAFNANDTDCGDFYKIDDITHWIPLPEPPES